ncbi:MAG: hypothetical protein ACOC5G_03470 [Acidobacteriota bacterium]
MTSPTLSSTLKEEECFSLSLDAQVQGRDAEGIKFKEKTSTKEISSEKAVFELKTKVCIGTKLKASLHIPKTLVLEHPLKLTISGEVVKAVIDSNNHNHQNVFLKLNKDFNIQKAN